MTEHTRLRRVQIGNILIPMQALANKLKLDLQPHTRGESVQKG